MQSEAELVGASQSVTGSLQRSRQVMLEQIDNTQSILASMDASHEQLSKVTKEYQGQSDVFGTSKRLLRTLKRHSSWDKLVLYGGGALFLLVCLYVIQKRSLYFVPTFVKTGLGKLVPTWQRSSAKDIDHLTRPIKGKQQSKPFKIASWLSAAWLVLTWSRCVDCLVFIETHARRAHRPHTDCTVTKQLLLSPVCMHEELLGTH